MKDYDIRLINGRLEIIGPPEDARIYEIESPVANRIIKLRVASHLLQRAREILDRVGPRSEDFHLSEAAAAAASSLYFACFQTGELSAQLKSRQVFKGVPEALDRHNDWKKIRDNRFNHPENIGREFKGGAIIGSDGQFLDFYVVCLDIPMAGAQGWLQILYQLICHTQQHVDEEAQSATARLRREFQENRHDVSSNSPNMEIKRPKY